MPRTSSAVQEDYNKLATARELQVTRESCGRILQGVGYVFTVWETVQVLQSQQSDTMILDGFAPRLQKHLGLRGVIAVRKLLNLL